ncbi:ABC transporter permease [Calycomorphotria hydatis]|uniref:Sulfate transport system permease protein CysW n=1 Tax=Calycomorphotria hydatis TaxID=2528027 RepID=A0A517T9N2_9PLAN|nr:ABC transporter permease [Calycomorphotria hydatis]QDT65076.1 Sulfate transport system permease protein CysW [Calycomorphotria hydatis]
MPPPEQNETSVTVNRHRNMRSRWHGDYLFGAGLWSITLLYIALLLCMVAAQTSYTWPYQIIEVVSRPGIQASLLLTLQSSTTAAVLALVVGVPISYLMSRCQFPGKGVLDAVLDIPNVLPPLVLGLCLLILFQYAPFSRISSLVVYQVPAVFLAQFVVATAYAIPVIRATFERIDPRAEMVALTMGCSRLQAFTAVTLREARYGLIMAATMSWARCLGSFGPLLVFAGVTRNKTEVLSTTIFLELSVGDISAAVAVSTILIVLSCSVLSFVRYLSSFHVTPSPTSL